MAHRFTEYEKQYIRDHAPHSTYAQVARELGLVDTSVGNWARTHGVPYSIDVVKANRVEGLHRMHSNPESKRSHYEKVSKSRKETFRKERMRDKYGLTRHTNVKVGSIPRHIEDFRWRSKFRRGYIYTDCRCTDSDPYVLYYDDNTRRYKNEEELAQRHHVRIEPIENLRGRL